MKRFIGAVILLLVIILLTITANVHLINLSDELIKLSSNVENIENIKDFWDKNAVWFNVLLPHEQIKDVNLLINELDYSKNVNDTLTKLKNSSVNLKDDIKVSTENVF